MGWGFGWKSWMNLCSSSLHSGCCSQIIKHAYLHANNRLAGFSWTMFLTPHFPSVLLPIFLQARSLHPPLISSFFPCSLSLSLPVLQCDVTTRELMFRILGVLHSSFPTHTHSTNESRHWRTRPPTPRQCLLSLQSICALQLYEVIASRDGVRKHLDCF